MAQAFMGGLTRNEMNLVSVRTRIRGIKGHCQRLKVPGLWPYGIADDRKSGVKLFTRILKMLAVAGCLWMSRGAGAAELAAVGRPGGFHFDGKISRQVLENYLSRSICIEGMLNGRGPLADDIRMVTNCGAK